MDAALHAVQPASGAQFAGAAVVERARSRLGEDRYRFWTNNCGRPIHYIGNLPRLSGNGYATGRRHTAGEGEA